MKIEIEKGVPQPVGRSTGITSSMRSMSIGESFKYPIKKRTDLANFAQRAGIKIKTAKISETEIRCWRTE